jgi:hypothetical protein
VTVTATSLNPQVTVELGVGTLNGAVCSATSQAAVQQGGAVASSVSGSGTYCAVLSDAGGLTAAVSYTISVEHP